MIFTQLWGGRNGEVTRHSGRVLQGSAVRGESAGRGAWHDAGVGGCGQMLTSEKQCTGGGLTRRWFSMKELKMKVLTVDVLGGKHSRQPAGKVSEVGAGVGRLPGVCQEQPSGKEQKEWVESKGRWGERAKVIRLMLGSHRSYSTLTFGLEELWAENWLGVICTQQDPPAAVLTRDWVD